MKEKIDYNECPIGTAITIIGGKWKIPVLYNLRDETLRFNQLQKALPQVTQKMLTQQLRELERDGLISRKIYAQVPPRVEYTITPLAKKLEPILDALCHWGNEYQKNKDVKNKVSA
ncbi:helix-turn-helix transcriptional regulator [Rickettsiales bacterium]|nr:helix-turn-helix transcriptional regulator [Rickettsiales bacterium]